MRRSSRIYQLLIVIALSGFFGCQNNQPVEITLAVTTDVHGALFPSNWFGEEALSGSLAHVQGWVQSEKNAGHTVILMDNGDLIQGNPTVYYSNYIANQSTNIAARVLNYMDYQTATVGNHDIEAGHPVYDKLYSEFDFPWMAANATQPGSRESYFTPYTVIQKEGWKIVVLGMVTPDVPTWLPPVLYEGIEFQNMVETAAYWVEIIQEKEKPDLLVGLFHNGARACREVAEQVPGFDIVFAGHDHRNHHEWVVSASGDSVLLLDSRSQAEEIAYATVKRENSLTITGGHVQMNTVEPDQEMMDHFQGYLDSVKAFVDEPIATLSETLSSAGAYFGPNAFMDLIHRAQMDLAEAEISFAAPLSFNTTLPAGPLQMRSLFQLYRYENLLYAMELTGQEILNYLNYSYSLWINTYQGPQDPVLNMEQSTNGSWWFQHPYYNFDAAAGIQYEVNIRKPVGEQVKILGFSDGQPFDLEKSYRVAINSYRASGGGGHLTEGAGIPHADLTDRIRWISDHDLRYHLGEWMKAKSIVEPTLISDWRFVPEKTARQALARDRERLFGVSTH